MSYTLRSSRQFVMSKKNLIIVQVTSAMLGRYLQKSKKQAKNVTKKEKEDGIIRACYQARRSFVIKDRPINFEGRLIFSTNEDRKDDLWA